MLDFLVGAGLALIAQPSVTSNAEFDCSATAQIEVTGTPYTVCGVRMDSESTYLVQNDGSETVIGSAVQPWRPSGSRDAGTLWVGRRADNIIVTASLDGTSGVMFGRDSMNGGWRQSSINCGEHGLQHVYGFSDDNRYAGIGYSHADQHLFCRLDFETMTQTQGWVEPQGEFASLEDLPVERWLNPAEAEPRAEPASTVQDACNDTATAVAAIAPINARTVQCGVSVDEGQVRIHYPDGRTFPVSGLDVGRNCEADCEQYGPNMISEFWAHDAGPTKVLGLRNAFEDRVYLISRDESGDRGWYARPFHCGKYGPFHIFPYTPQSEYVFAASYEEQGLLIICALHTHDGASEALGFGEMEDDIYNYNATALSISGWNCGGQEEFDAPVFCMSITAPDGRELYRSENLQREATPPTGTRDPVVLEAVNFPGWFMRRVSGLADMVQNSTPLADEQSRLQIVPALNGAENAVSIAFIGEDNHYLRHAGYRIRINANDGTDLFAADATFYIRPGLAGEGTVSFESANFPGHFIRHRNAQLWIDASDGSELFALDASWNVRQ